MRIQKSNEKGFAVIESALILIIIAAVIGIGGYVIKQKNSTKASVETSTSSTKISASKEIVVIPSTASKLAVVNATNSEITKLISDESDNEFNLDNTADSDTVSNINGSDKAATNIGDSFNENDL